MALGVPRPRHGRQPSRIPRSADSGTDGIEVTQRKGNDDATVKYIKRILCARSGQTGSPLDSSATDSKTLDELLPPLTSSNEVDVQLYALIAVILSNFVQTWYNRITPDQDFVAEVIQIIAHCTRGLEERIRHVDLATLLLDEIPAVVNAHIDGGCKKLYLMFSVRADMVSCEYCANRCA